MIDHVALRGNQVAFAGEPEKADGHDRIYIGDIGHWGPRFLRESRPEPSAYFSQLSHDWIVWRADGGGTSWAVYALSRATGREYTIDSSRRDGPWTPDYSLPNISLSGRVVAWSYFRCASRCGSSKPRIETSVAVKRLPAGAVHVVHTSEYPCDSALPSLWGIVLVWHQEGKCARHTGSDVLMYNLKSHRLVHLTHNRGASEAVANGRYVAWKQGRAGSSRFDDRADMMLLKLATGKRLRADGVPPKGCGEARGGDDAPVIGRRILAWKSGNGAFITARDLGPGKVFTVCCTKKGRPGLESVVDTPGEAPGHLGETGCLAGCSLSPRRKCLYAEGGDSRRPLTSLLSPVECFWPPFQAQT